MRPEYLASYARIRYQNNTASGTPAAIWTPSVPNARLVITDISVSVRSGAGLIQVVDNAVGTPNVLFDAQVNGIAHFFEKYQTPEMTAAPGNVIKLYNPGGVDVLIILRGFEAV